MVDKGDVEGVKVLLGGGAKPNIAGEGGWMPLHRAIGGVAPATAPGQPAAPPRANPEMVALLLGKGANANALLANGKAPLHMALENDDLEAARTLLEGGAKPGIKKADGVLPLYTAVAKNKPEAVKLLLAHGANPDDDASLYIAVQQNNLPMLQLLLNAKANPEKAFQSWTPLHKAAADGYSEAYRMLMAAGARDTVRNDDGKTPRDLARERQERIAAQQEAERIAAQERREASERRAQMFMAGMTTLAGAYSEAVQEQAAQQASQRQMLANIQAQADAKRRQQEAAAAAQAAERRQQQAAEQAAGRQALANQLADGIAYRNAQMERTTDAATRNRLAADNAKALQAAQQIGAYDQVNRQAIAATSANQSAARQQRETQAQQEAEAARRAAQERQQRLAQQQAEERQRQAEQAERERQRQLAEREAERQRAEEQRRQAAELRRQQEEERNRPVAYREGITLCSPATYGKNVWSCKGPLQNTSGNLGDDPTSSWAVTKACATDSSNIRDLGMVSGYRAFGCGYGIHPTDRKYPGNRDIPADLGVNYIPDRGTFYCSTSRVFAYCKGRG
ncbi:MAG: ankyrin repeat domain-containing protein [Gammaproteobacteria bacterium]